MSANQIYNIHLLAKKGTQVVSGSDAKVKFNFDWNLLPKGKYKASFTFLGAKNVLLGENLCLVYCNLGNSKSFEATGSTSAQTSNILGHLFPSSLSANNTSVNYLYAKLNTNSPIIIDSLPVTNEIVIELLNNAVPPVPFLDENSFAVQPVGSDRGWVLSLSLEYLGN